MPVSLLVGDAETLGVNKMKDIDIKHELQNAMVRDIIAHADILTLLEVLASVCQRLNVDLDVWNFFHEIRSDFLQAKIAEIEDSDPAFAKVLRKHIDRAKMEIESKILETDS
jgi:hypothetical protein